MWLWAKEYQNTCVKFLRKTMQSYGILEGSQMEWAICPMPRDKTVEFGEIEKIMTS